MLRITLEYEAHGREVKIVREYPYDRAVETDSELADTVDRVTSQIARSFRGTLGA